MRRRAEAGSRTQVLGLQNFGSLVRRRSENSVVSGVSRRSFIERIPRVFDLGFGCHPRDLSLVFTLTARLIGCGGDCGCLTELVRDDNICCEVRPSYMGTGGARRQVGFDSEFWGSDSSERYHLNPTCPMCELVHAERLAVTGRIVPKSGKSGRYDVDTHSKLVMWTSTLGSRPFATLSIRILDGQRFDRCIDPCENQPFDTDQEIRELLDELGVRDA